MNNKNKMILVIISILLCGMILGYMFHESKTQSEIRTEALKIHNSWINSQTKVSLNISDICTDGSFNNGTKK